MNFLPDDYKMPSANQNYLKLQEGENRIRILSQPIIGWEDWIDNKPVRYEMKDKPAKSNDPTKPLRHFWAMVVWNYNEQRIQIMQINQATLRKAIMGLCQDKDWGAPYFYDIKIVKTGKSKDTDYQVMPIPPTKPLDPAIEKAYNENKCWLGALFEGQDPFAETWATYTPGIFKKEDTPKNEISAEQLNALDDMIGEDHHYRTSILSQLKKRGISELSQIPKDLYEPIFNGAKKNFEDRMKTKQNTTLKQKVG